MKNSGPAPSARRHRFLTFLSLPLLLCLLWAGPNTAIAADDSPGDLIATIPVSALPQDVAFSPDGRLAYLVAFDGMTVDVIDLDSLTRTESLSIGIPVGAIGVLDDYSTIIVSNDPGDSVVLVDPASGEHLGVLKTGLFPIAIVTIPGTRSFISSNNGAGTISVTDLDTQATKAIPVGAEPWGVALSPDGDTAYVALRAENALVAVDLDSGAVISRTAVGERPAYVWVSPDGSTAYVTEAGAGTVAVVALGSSPRVTGRLTVGGVPWSISGSPDGSTLYVADNQSGTLVSMRTGGQVLATTPTGSRPTFVAVTERGDTVLVVNAGSNTVSAIRGFGVIESGGGAGGTDSSGGESGAAGDAVTTDGTVATGGSSAPLIADPLTIALIALLLATGALVVLLLLRRSASRAEPGNEGDSNEPVEPVATDTTDDSPVCSSCGAPTFDYKFCESCGAATGLLLSK